MITTRFDLVFSMKEVVFMNEDKLGKMNMWKLCFIMGMPTVVAQLINLLYNIVDRVYIGNMELVGKEALAGLGLVSPIIIFISAFSSFVSGGGAPLAAQALGQKDLVRAKKLLGNGFFLLLLFSIVLTTIAFVVKEPLLFAIGASENTFKYANDYLSIYLIGTIFVQISIGLNTFMTAQGRSGIAMISVLIGAILNIILDPIFIFGFGLGIKGAAIATIVSQLFSAIFVLVFLFNPKTTLRIEKEYIKPDLKIILATLALGVAPFVMASTESFIGFVLNGGLQKYGGDDYVALLAILQSVMMLISTPLSGFTTGVSAIISYNFGAKNKKRLISCFKIMMFICFIYCNVFGIAIMVFPKFFGSFFTDDPTLLNLTQLYLPIFISGMLIFGIQRACQSTFVALGAAKISLFIALLRKVILLIPLAILLPKFYGVGGIYYSEAIADFIAPIVCVILFIIIFKKILREMPDESALSNEN